jgi:hypothetical protein
MSNATLDVDKLFLWFMTIFGSQKMATAWGNVPAPERAAVWGRALGKYPAKTVYAAMNDLAEHGTGWPPTLPEFVQMVRDSAPRPEHQPALPPPARTAADIEAGARIAKEIAQTTASAGSKEPSAWAFRVLERADDRDSGLSPVSIQFALEAIHNTGKRPPDHWAERFERVNRHNRGLA